MILPNERIKQITTEDGFYDCRLLQQQFAYKLFGDAISPNGDLICFVAPTKINSLKINSALVIAGELPNANLFGGSCFTRLFCTQLGSLISLITNKECYLNNDCLFFDGHQISFTLLNKVKESIIFHIVLILDSEHEQIGALTLENAHMIQFQNNLVDCFKYLVQCISIETRRDNF